MDHDLEQLSREALIKEIISLRTAIRAHRDSTGQGLCWHHPALWGLLPEHATASPVVPAWPEFMRGCIRYRQSLDEQTPESERSHEEYPEADRE